MNVGVFSNRLRAWADFRLKVLERTVAKEEQRVAFLEKKNINLKNVVVPNTRSDIFCLELAPCCKISKLFLIIRMQIGLVGNVYNK
jgi:hypothetical protein